MAVAVPERNDRVNRASARMAEWLREGNSDLLQHVDGASAKQILRNTYTLRFCVEVSTSDKLWPAPRMRARGAAVLEARRGPLDVSSALERLATHNGCPKLDVETWRGRPTSR